MTKKSPVKNHVYLIDDGESFWYVAPSARAALQRYVKDSYHPLTVTQFRKQYPNTKVSQCADRKRFTVAFEQLNGEFKDETRTFGGWAKNWIEGGMLATSLL